MFGFFVLCGPACFAREINLVFVPLHYQDNKDFLQDKTALLKRLANTTPFNEFPASVKSLEMYPSEREKEKFFKTTQGIPPYKIDPIFLKNIHGKIGANYKLVVLDENSSGSYAQMSFPEITSILILGRAGYKNDESFSKGFLHELGHSLGLRDESPEITAKGSLPGFPNCAVTKQEARQWWGDLAGKDPRVSYIYGCCGNTNYIRPTIASLMNDIEKADDFGPVNERYLRQIFK